MPQSPLGDAGRMRTGLWLGNSFVFKVLKPRKVGGDACLDTFLHLVGSREVF